MKKLPVSLVGVLVALGLAQRGLADEFWYGRIPDAQCNDYWYDDSPQCSCGAPFTLDLRIDLEEYTCCGPLGAYTDLIYALFEWACGDSEHEEQGSCGEDCEYRIYPGSCGSMVLSMIWSSSSGEWEWADYWDMGVDNADCDPNMSVGVQATAGS